ncbi:Protein ltv1 [Coemansia sp. RSA 1086]|nr:Protein ltv1 [Coemansia sp. RSA 1086]
MASRKTQESSEQGKPLPTPHTRAGRRVIDTAAERQRLMDLFGTYGNTRAAATSSSSSQHNELESPSPPTSANASTNSSGQLPENIHLSMPAMPRTADAPQPRVYSKSANRSRVNITQPSHNIAEKRVPAEAGAALNERQRRKIARAYNNQFAHLLGNAQSADSGISPAVSVMTGSSFNSPRTITLEEMRQASRPEAMSNDSLNRPRGKWSQGTTPSPAQDRDSGLFGNQVFAPSPVSRFEPIQEEAGESPANSGAAKPKYDVHVPRPETLARTQTLGTRSPTPTERPSSSAGMSPQSTRRRRATTTADDNDGSQRLYKEHARSRSFGSESTEQITLQQLRQQQQAMLPLIPPPPPANARQFQSPFLEQQQQHVESDRESATHTRIRRQRRQASSVMSATSPSYTLSSAYSPSNAGSDLAYELTFLGVHPTVESPYTHSVMSRNSNSRPTLPAPGNASRIMSDSSHRRRSSSMASNDPTEELRAARRQMGHVRSGSAGSRRQRQRQQDTDNESDQWSEDYEDEAKSNFSMSSSAMFRNAKLTLLDEQFDKLEAIYEHDDTDSEAERYDSDGHYIAEYDSDGNVKPISSRADFESVLNEFLNDYELTGKKMQAVVEGGSGAGKLDTYRDGLVEGSEASKRAVVQAAQRILEESATKSDKQDADELDEIFKEKERTPWDCQSILSTYSTLDNHPATIHEKRTPRIRVSSKSGFPVVVEDQPRPEAEPRPNRGAPRPKNETAEEKRLRKKQLQEERRKRREQKRETQSSFAEKKKRSMQSKKDRRQHVVQL